MGKIYCLMGKSSSGKDTIFKRLLEREDLKLKRIVPYTTRPIRENETDGVEYCFCDRATRDRLIAAGKVIELRSYETVHGIWNYFTVDDGKTDLKKHDYLMIGTIDTYKSLVKYYEKAEVLPIYIDVEDGIRLERALKREKQQVAPRYEEMCRRFLADSRDFSKERLKEAGIGARQIFRNDSVEEAVEAVARYIRRSR